MAMRALAVALIRSGGIPCDTHTIPATTRIVTCRRTPSRAEHQHAHKHASPISRSYRMAKGRLDDDVCVYVCVRVRFAMLDVSPHGCLGKKKFF